MTRQQAEAWRVEHALSGEGVNTRNAFTIARVDFGFCKRCDRTVEFLVRAYTQCNAQYPPRLLRCKCGALQGLYKDFKIHGPCIRCNEIPEPREFNSKRAGGKYWQPACGCGYTRIRSGQGNYLRVIKG